MNNPLEYIGELKDRFPEAIQEIEADQARVSQLLQMQDYSMLPQTKDLIQLCRRDILFARTQLATTRKLEVEQRDALWNIIDARQWFLAMVVKDYEAELWQISRELEASLHS